MANDILAEALARVEYKLDLLMQNFGIKGAPMEFEASYCPVCSQPVKYQIDVVKNVVVRRCGCKTGKSAAIIPLTAITGVQGNGNPSQSITDLVRAAVSESSQDSSGRKDR